MNLQAYSDYNDRAKDLNSNLSVAEDFRDNIPQDTNNNIQSEDLIKIINELRDENKRLATTCGNNFNKITKSKKIISRKQQCI